MGIFDHIFDIGEGELPEEGDRILLVIPDEEYLRIAPGRIEEAEHSDGEFENVRATLNDYPQSYYNKSVRDFDNRGEPFTISAYNWATQASELPLDDRDYRYFYTYFDPYESHKQIHHSDRIFSLPKLRVGREVVLPDSREGQDSRVTICKHPPECIDEMSWKSAVSLSAFVLKTGGEVSLGEEKITVCKKCKSIIDNWQ